jgi:preprotein translocase subunit SecF
MLSPSAPQTSQADQASMCKSTNQIPDLYTSLQKCTNQTEATRMQTFMEMATNPKADFDQMNAVYNDLLLSGDSIFGTMPHQTTVQQIKDRNNELKKQTNTLEKSIQEKESIVERSDRDFIDTKEQIGTIKTKTVHVLDDYTLVVLAVAYVFFAITVTVWYLQQNYYSPKAIGTALVSVVIITGLIYGIIINFL